MKKMMLLIVVASLLTAVVIANAGDRIFFSEDGQGWALYGRNLYNSTDSGASWVAILGEIHCFFVGDEDVYAAGKGGIFKQSDSTWNKTSIDSTIIVESILFVSDNEGFAVGCKFQDGKRASIILVSRNGGQSWQFLNFGVELNVEFNDICYKDSRLVIVGDYGVILTSKDKGENWDIHWTTNTHLEDVDPYGSSIVAIGAYATILENNNNNWCTRNHQYPSGARFRDFSHGWIASSEGLFYWFETDIYELAKSGTFEAVLCRPGKDVWVVEEGVGIYKFGGVTEISTGSTAPVSFELHQNYPNPFNPETTIKFNLPTKVHVWVTIYNVLGQRIKTLVNDSCFNPGVHSVVWDGTAQNNQVVGGIYFYKLQADNFSQVRRMTLLK